MKKTLVFTIVAAILCTLMTIFASAEEITGTRVATKIPIGDFTYEESIDPLKDYVPTDMDFLVDTMITRSTMTQIKIVQVGDQYFQDMYPNNPLL